MVMNEKTIEVLNKFVEKQNSFNDKIIRDLNRSIDQIKRILGKFNFNLTKMKERTQEQLEVRKEQFQKHFNGLQLELLKLESYSKPKDKKFWPAEIHQPRTFLQEFIATGRLDFLNYFLKAKFGDHFRGDRYDSIWEKQADGKYKRVVLETDFFSEWAEICEWDHNLVLQNPTDYLPIKGNGAFYDQLDKVIESKQHYLNQKNFKKFLIYMHKSLGPLK